jgi:hypothetical protein
MKEKKREKEIHREKEKKILSRYVLEIDRRCYTNASLKDV